MRIRGYLPEIFLGALVMILFGYIIACGVSTVTYQFSSQAEPAPFLATLPALLIAFAAAFFLFIALCLRLLKVGREAYRRASEREKALTRKVGMALLRGVKQSDGVWGERAKVAEDFYREVTSENQ